MKKISKSKAKQLRDKGVKIKSTKNGYYILG